MKEAATQRAILEYLALKRYFHWRNNTGAYKTARGGFIRYGTPGSSPDIFLIKNGFVWGIEVKTERGKLSEHQEAFCVAFTEAGATYLVARSIDDVVRAGL